MRVCVCVCVCDCVCSNVFVSMKEFLSMINMLVDLRIAPVRCPRNQACPACLVAIDCRMRLSGPETTDYETQCYHCPIFAHCFRLMSLLEMTCEINVDSSVFAALSFAAGNDTGGARPCDARGAEKPVSVTTRANHARDELCLSMTTRLCTATNLLTGPLH